MPLRKKLGPGSVLNAITARPPQPATCETRDKFSEKRCIHRRCRSMRVIFAAKYPFSVTVRSTVPCRIDAAYSSGSVNARTALDGMETSKSDLTKRVKMGTVVCLSSSNNL